MHKQNLKKKLKKTRDVIFLFIKNKKGLSLPSLFTALAIFSFLTLVMIRVVTSTFNFEKKTETLLEEGDQNNLILSLITRDWSLASPSLNNLRCKHNTDSEDQLQGCSEIVFSSGDERYKHKKNFFRYYTKNTGLKEEDDFDETIEFKLNYTANTKNLTRSFLLLQADSEHKPKPIFLKDILKKRSSGEKPEIDFNKFKDILNSDSYFPNIEHYFFTLFTPILVPRGFPPPNNLQKPMPVRYPTLLLKHHNENIELTHIPKGNKGLWDAQKHFEIAENNTDNFYAESTESIHGFIRRLPTVGGRSIFLFVQKVNFIRYHLLSNGDLYRQLSKTKYIEAPKDRTSIPESSQLIAKNICSITLSRKMNETKLVITVKSDFSGSFNCN